MLHVGHSRRDGGWPFGQFEDWQGIATALIVVAERQVLEELPRATHTHREAWLCVMQLPVPRPTPPQEVFQAVDVDDSSFLLVIQIFMPSSPPQANMVPADTRRLPSHNI